VNVSDLREHIKGLPGDMEVVVQVDADGGCEDVAAVAQTAIGDSGAGGAGADYVRLEAVPHRSAVVIVLMT